MRNYRYDLGFAVDGTAIPDPAGFSGETADLDVSGERDTTGLLHRDRVAQKVPTEMQYKNITWAMLNFILGLLNKDSFQFTFPDPNTGGLRTGTYYTGNRKWTAVWLPAGEGPEGWYVDLTFSVIEY